MVLHCFLHDTQKFVITQVITCDWIIFLKESRLRLKSLRIDKGIYVTTTELNTTLYWIYKTQIETHNRNNSLELHINFKTKQCKNCSLVGAITTLNWTTDGKIETDAIDANYDKILITYSFVNIIAVVRILNLQHLWCWNISTLKLEDEINWKINGNV